MKKTLSILNLASVILVILVNYISQAIQLNNTTIGEMSNQYDNLFTPASYAFSIWGLIFIGLLAYGIFQVKVAFNGSKYDDYITQTGYWFIIANLLNSAWVFAFIYDFTGVSVILMLGILCALIKVIINTNMERWDAPLRIIAFVWWPICLYSGWISVATIANISTYLSKIGWEGGFLSPETWTVVMIIVALILNIFMIISRHMREFAMVGIWALVAIFVRHLETIPSIAYTAITAAVIIFVIAGWQGHKYRHSNPIFKKSK